MNIWVVLLGTLTVFHLNCDVVEGADCYKCMYIEGMTQEEAEAEYTHYEKDWWDESCKLGNKPDGKFLKTCRDEYSCSKMSFIGKHPNSKKEITVTWRQCDEPEETVKSKCMDMTIPEFEKDPDWNPGNVFEENFDGLRDIMELSESRANICYCGADKCNTATRFSSASQSMIITLMMCIFIAGNFLHHNFI